MFRVLAVIVVSFAAAIAIAAVVWTASHGHIVLFPLVLLFGVPFIPLLSRRNSG
ncbi:MAG TPA: hypothetical protein VGR69_01005 [Candidatus Rubrimentiphilum sp.]|nr:hypothetical protein [Candidatus Rubrimentiphilum sp.]